MDISNLKKLELAKGIAGRYFHTEHMTVGFVEIEQGAILPLHSHHHEQLTQVTKGQLQMTIGENTFVLIPGQVYCIPSNVPHNAVALTACEVTDTFYPVREDYK